jgi:23S rRNA G2445 N2-methylase RlmL
MNEMTDGDKHSASLRGAAAKKPGSSGWERNLKRLVKARRLRWIFTAPPVFRPLLLDELKELGIEDAENHGAGISFTAKAAEVYPLLMQVKSAGRLFLLVDEFRAGAAEELYRKASLVPWELLLPEKPELSIRVTLRRCRIEHEGAAGNTLRMAIEDRLGYAGSGEGTPQLLELFGEENRIELRLDASGEQLYRRGYRKLVGDAPVRESTAASLLRWYVKERGSFSVLHDPMCGSGTFPIEAWALARHVPLASARDFSLFTWPVFSPPAWEYERKQLFASVLKDDTGAGSVFVFGSDREASMVKIALENCRAALTPELSEITGSPRFFKADFFRSDPETLPGFPAECGGKRKVLVINPPYGVRMKAESSLFAEIIEQKNRHWKEWDLLLLAPREASLPVPLRSILFENGGIPLKASIYGP